MTAAITSSCVSWIARNRLLFGILALGLCLRIATVLWGIPVSPYVHSYHPDEAKAYQTTADFPKVYITDARFLQYGTAVPYVLGILLLPVKFVVVHLLKAQDLYLVLVWLVSRFFSVLCGVGSIYLGYLLGRKLFDPRTGIVAAALIATSFYHAMNSALATLDVPMSFLVLANFLMCFRAAERSRVADYVLSGILSALLVGTKVAGAVFLPVPFLLYLSQRNSGAPLEKNPRSQARVGLRHLLAYCVTAVVVFAIFHPHLVLDPEKYYITFLDAKFYWFDRSETTLARMLIRWMTATSTAIGWPVLLAAFVGVFLPSRSRLYSFMLVVVIGLYYGLWRSYLPARFLITVAPLLCLFAANTCGRLLAQEKPWFRSCGIICLVVVLTQSLYLCASGIFLRYSETRTLAARYLAENVERGTTIGLSAVSEKYPWHHHAWRYPLIDLSKYREVSFLNEPEVVVVSSYDLTQIEEALSSKALLSGYEWDSRYNKDWYRYSPPSPRMFRFYADLLSGESSKYVLAKRFAVRINVPLEFPPPETRIYYKRKEVISD